MRAYFLFEFNRTFKLEKGLLIITLLIIFMLFAVNKDSSAKEKQYIDTKIRYTEEMAKKNNDVLTSSYEMEAQDSKNKNAYPLEDVLEIQNTFSKKEINVYQEFQKKNWSPYLARENEYIGKIEFDNIYIKRDIRFLEEIPTFVKIKKSLNNVLIKQALPYESTRYGTSNFLFLYSLFSYLCSPLGIAIYLLFFGAIHFKSFSEDKIKSIITMPISRSSILISNTAIFLFRIIRITSIICLFAFIIASIGGGSVPYDYPVITFNQGIQLTPAFYYLIKTMLLFFSILIFSFVLCQLIVLLTKTNFMAILLSILLISSFSFVFQTKELSRQPYAAFIPFTYTTPSKVISGQSKEDIIYTGNSDVNGYPKTIILENQGYYVGDSLSKRNPYISDGLGAVVVTSWTLITLGLSSFIMKKRTF